MPSNKKRRGRDKKKKKKLKKQTKKEEKEEKEKKERATSDSDTTHDGNDTNNNGNDTTTTNNDNDTSNNGNDTNHNEEDLEQDTNHNEEDLEQEWDRNLMTLYLFDLKMKQREYDEKMLSRMESYDNLQSFFEEEESNIVDYLTTPTNDEFTIESDDDEVLLATDEDAIRDRRRYEARVKDIYGEVWCEETEEALAEIFGKTRHSSEQQPARCLHAVPRRGITNYHPVSMALWWCAYLEEKSIDDVDVEHEKSIESNANRVHGTKSNNQRDGPGEFLRQNIILSARILRQRFIDLRTKNHVELFGVMMSRDVADWLLGDDVVPGVVLPESSTDEECNQDEGRQYQQLALEFAAGLIVCLEALAEDGGNESSMELREYEMEKKLRNIHSIGARRWISIFHKRLPCDCLGPMRRALKSQRKTYQCYCCHKRLFDRLQCSGCKIANYCDSNCQREHWHDHKSFCRRFCRLIDNDDDDDAATATAAPLEDPE